MYEQNLTLEGCWIAYMCKYYLCSEKSSFLKRTKSTTGDIINLPFNYFFFYCPVVYGQNKSGDEDYLKRKDSSQSFLMLKTKCRPIFPPSDSYMCVELTAELDGKQCTHGGLQMICLETVSTIWFLAWENKDDHKDNTWVAPHTRTRSWIPAAQVATIHPSSPLSGISGCGGGP